MSSLTLGEKARFENLLGMDSGYVLDFTDSTFARFMAEHADVDIHAEKYQKYGTSKAKKLRAFWDDEADSIVAKVLRALITRRLASTRSPPSPDVVEGCKAAVSRLELGASGFVALKAHAARVDPVYLAAQIERMEAAVHSDPSLALGTAKELIETACKTVLSERKIPHDPKADVPVLAKAALQGLELLPTSLHDAPKGSEIIRRLLQSVAHNTAELRNLYGTGHGKSAGSVSIEPVQAAMIAGAAASFARFLLESHWAQPPKP